MQVFRGHGSCMDQLKAYFKPTRNKIEALMLFSCYPAIILNLYGEYWVTCHSEQWFTHSIIKEISINLGCHLIPRKYITYVQK